MRYIENYELREWIKENLKKTIFQKAHALAVQTGCDILVKLQDASAPTTHQSYATGSIQKAYNNNALRRAPDEKSVSGITGLPLTDQSVQSEISQASISTEELVSSMGGTVGDLVANQTYSSQNETTDFSDQTDNTMAQDVAVPMHISTNSHVSTDTSSTVSQAQQFENDPDDIVDVQIKQEPIEIIDANDDFSEETETKQEQDDEPDFSSHQEQELTGTPLFVQTPVTARSGVTRYPVPMSPKPYQCGVCHKAFRSVHVLQKHTLTFHMKPQIKLAPRRGRGRGSHYLNRPSHQAPQTSTYPVFPGGGTDQTPMTTQPSLQDIPGTSSQQIAHMAQIASSQFPSNSPVAVTPSTSDFSPSSAMFQSPPSGPSTISSPAQQGQGSGRAKMDTLATTMTAILDRLNNPAAPAAHHIPNYHIPDHQVAPAAPMAQPPPRFLPGTTEDTVVIGNNRAFTNIDRDAYFSILRKPDITGLKYVLKLLSVIYSKEELKDFNMKGGPTAVNGGVVQKRSIADEVNFKAIWAQAEKEFAGCTVGPNGEAIRRAISNKCNKARRSLAANVQA